MSFSYKSKEELVNDVISSISNKMPDIDFSDGEPLRTIIEAIMNEVDIQYWQLEQNYNSSFIDTAYGEDLSNLVKILGISRTPSTNSIGRVKFYRETPAVLDYSIPAGTLVETLPNANGDIIRFETTQNVILSTGQKEIYADVISTLKGSSSNVIANKVIIINNPPMGIESVINTEAIIGGEDDETDTALRERAKSALESSGLGTIDAIENKLLGVAGINSVKITDMARGIGTIDILVLGDAIPLPSSKLTEITNLVQSIKAGGIDFRIIEPSIVTQNINITLTLESGVVVSDVQSTVNSAIEKYFKTLQIGETFIKNQLAKEVLNSSESIIDIAINTPAANVNPGANNIITLGTITLN